MNEERYEMSDDGTLKISNVEIDDSAKYVCKAENKFGLPVIASAFVTIRSKTKVVKGPEHALYYQGEQTFYILSLLFFSTRCNYVSKQL